MDNQKSRDLFLEEFTKELIKNSRKPGMEIALSEHPVKSYSEPIPQFIKRVIETQPMKTLPLIPNLPGKIQPRINFTPNQIQPMNIPATKPGPAALVLPSPQPLPANFSLGKLDPLILDTKVTTLECPGPGKFVFVKILGRTSPTRITLSEEEIKKAIDTFSKESKIPVIGGLFKAAVGNLIITAVISDFVGSRFIINKYTPYSILEPQSQDIYR